MSGDNPLASSALPSGGRDSWSSRSQPSVRVQLAEPGSAEKPPKPLPIVARQQYVNSYRDVLGSRCGGPMYATKSTRRDTCVTFTPKIGPFVACGPSDLPPPPELLALPNRDPTSICRGWSPDGNMKFIGSFYFSRRQLLGSERCLLWRRILQALVGGLAAAGRRRETQNKAIPNASEPRSLPAKPGADRLLAWVRRRRTSSGDRGSTRTRQQYVLRFHPRLSMTLKHSGRPTRDRSCQRPSPSVAAHIAVSGFSLLNPKIRDLKHPRTSVLLFEPSRPAKPGADMPNPCVHYLRTFGPGKYK